MDTHMATILLFDESSGIIKAVKKLLSAIFIIFIYLLVFLLPKIMNVIFFR